MPDRLNDTRHARKKKSEKQTQKNKREIMKAI